MMNLQDVFIIENLSIINEGKSGPLKIRGIFQRADEANQNKRVYPKKVLENQVSHLAEAIKDRRLVGELDHPTYEMVKLSNASHLITGLSFQGNEVVGEAEILPTPAGKVVEGLIRGGVKIGISSRGMGTLSEGRNGTKTVNEDFRLVTFDIVADPSTRGAYPTLSESKEYKKDKKIIESTIKNVVGERYFLKLLEKKIDEKLNEGGRIAGRYSDDEGDDDDMPPPEVVAKRKAQEQRAARQAADEREELARRRKAREQEKSEELEENKKSQSEKQTRKKVEARKRRQAKKGGDMFGLGKLPKSKKGRRGMSDKRSREIDAEEQESQYPRY